MNATRRLLVLSAGLNLMLAVVVARLVTRVPSISPASPELTMAANRSPDFIEPQFDVSQPPKIWANEEVSPVAGDQTADAKASRLTPTQSLERQRDVMRQTLLQMEESGEFTKPNIMWQTPPAAKLAPGRSTPFSTPRWDEHPVLKHGEP